ESSSSIASPELIGIALTNMGLPFAVLWSPRLNRSVMSLIHASFSELYVNISSIAFGGGVGPPFESVLWADGDLQLPIIIAVVTSSSSRRINFRNILLTPL